jgi:hypothetical protein
MNIGIDAVSDEFRKTVQLRPCHCAEFIIGKRHASKMVKTKHAPDEQD